MSVTLTTYPVTSNSGRVQNIFAGFDDVNVEFKREDIDTFVIGSGADSQVLITIASDITSELNIGEWLYLYGVGSTYTYDGVFKIIDLTFNSPNTEITIQTDFIEIASTGYINYKQNWFLESVLVSPDNVLVKKYPSLLQNDGSPSGIVNVNVSMLVDFLKNEILETSQEVTNSREICQLKYREVWREDETESFVLIDDTPIIVIFAAENSEGESFVNEFEVPKMFDGYPFFINLLHSTENLTETRLSVGFDELDINKDDITTDNKLADFNPFDFGILQVNFNDNENLINSNTRYINFNINESELADYQTGNYDDDDYLTINTP